MFVRLNALLAVFVFAVACGGRTGTLDSQKDSTSSGDPIVGDAGNTNDPTPLPIATVQPAIIIVSGDVQTVTVGQAFPAPLKVRVTGTQGEPVSDVTIAFTLQQGTGTIADASRTTDANGEASTTVTLGHVATDVVIQATWADAPEGAISTVQFHLHATPDVPSTWVVVSGANQCVLTNTTYPTPIVFRLTDQYGNPIPSVPVRLTPSNGTIAGLSLNQQLETQTDLDGKVSVSLSAGNASFANPAGDPVHITATYIPTPTLSTTVNLIASQASYLIPSPPDASLQAAKDFWIGGVYVVHYYTMGVYLYQLCGVPASGVNVTFENWNASPNPLPHTYTVVTNASGYAGRTYNNGNFDFIDQYNSTVKASAANYGYSGYNSWIILHWQN